MLVRIREKQGLVVYHQYEMMQELQEEEMFTSVCQVKHGKSVLGIYIFLTALICVASCHHFDLKSFHSTLPTTIKAQFSPHESTKKH